MLPRSDYSNLYGLDFDERTAENQRIVRTNKEAFLRDRERLVPPVRPGEYVWFADGKLGARSMEKQELLSSLILLDSSGGYLHHEPDGAPPTSTDPSLEHLMRSVGEACRHLGNRDDGTAALIVMASVRGGGTPFAFKERTSVPRVV